MFLSPLLITCMCIDSVMACFGWVPETETASSWNIRSIDISYLHLSTLHQRQPLIMSKKSGQGAFVTKSMFDVLSNEDQPEEEEVEEDDVSLDQVTE